MAGTAGCEPAMVSQSPKAGLSADWRLQLASMKLESLVIVDQLRHGEYVPGPCTHRPSRHGSCECPKSVQEPARGRAAEGGVDDWGEVVTRYPYRKVGMDHLLSMEYLWYTYG